MSAHEEIAVEAEHNNNVKRDTLNSTEDDDVPYLSQEQPSLINHAKNRRRRMPTARTTSSGLSISIPDPQPTADPRPLPEGPLYLHVLDSLRKPVTIIDATATEDPFLLESFETMIQASHAKQKHFILGRVATKRDGGGKPEDKIVEEEVWWSYYHAQFLNKVLFRTEPERRLLHRMRAKNPLNNLPIVGEAEYFIVRWDQKPQNQEESPVPSSDATDTTKVPEPDNSSALRSRRGTSTSESQQEEEQHPKSQPAAPPQSFLESSRAALSWLWTTSDASAGAPPSIQFRFVKKPYESDEPTRTVTFDDDEAAPFMGRRHTYVASHAGGTDWCIQSPIIKTPLSTRSPDSEQKVRWDGFLRKIRAQHDAMTLLSPTSANQPTSAPPILPQEASEPQSRKIYAEFLGTDDDFLLRSDVRQIFRENAMESDDAVLFALPSSVKSNVVLEQQDVRHPRLENVVIVPVSGPGSDAGASTRGGPGTATSRATAVCSLRALMIILGIVAWLTVFMMMILMPNPSAPLLPGILVVTGFCFAIAALVFERRAVRTAQRVDVARRRQMLLLRAAPLISRDAVLIGPEEVPTAAISPTTAAGRLV